MTFKEKKLLHYRLERAEHLLRAESISYSIVANSLEQKAEQLKAQANLLSKACSELWALEDEEVF